MLTKIIRKLDSLFIEAGLTNPSYKVYLDPKQGAGFFPTDEATTKVINKLSPTKEYDNLLNELVYIAKSLQTDYSFDRGDFYK